MAQTEQQRKANLRLGLILATIALVLGVGFVVRIALMGTA
ncbi:cytochrome oxidase small assembly protein [Ideonella sp.]